MRKLPLLLTLIPIASASIMMSSALWALEGDCECQCAPAKNTSVRQDKVLQPNAIREQSNAQQIKLQELKQKWAYSKYHVKSTAQQAAYKNAILAAEELTTLYPDMAEAWVWQGIIKASDASRKKGIAALMAVKSAKADLEKGLEMGPKNSLSFGQAVLGAIYHKVPGRPVGFKDKKKAENFLLKAMATDETNINANYFYAEFLIHQKRKEEAKPYLEKVMAAPTRTTYKIADEGRKAEARALLKTI